MHMVSGRGYERFGGVETTHDSWENCIWLVTFTREDLGLIENSSVHEWK